MISKPISTIKTISDAIAILELPEEVTMNNIKSKYKVLIKKWHPDLCVENSDICKEMTIKINIAYKIIMDYCDNYIYSFSQKEMKKHVSEEEWWFNRFGADPLWSC